MDKNILDKLNVNDIKFCIEPSLYNIDDYYEAIENYTKKILTTNEVVSIFQVGNFTVHGISDIDLILVLEKEVKAADTGIFSIFKLSRKDAYLFLHEPLIFNKELIKYIYYWSPYPSLKNIYGEKNQTEKPPEEEEKKISLILLIEEFINNKPRRALEMILRKRIRVREALCHINTVKYTVEKLESLTGESLGYEKFIQKYNEFRAGWFNTNDRYNILVDYLLKSIEISFSLSNVFAKYLNKNGYLQDSIPKVKNPYDFKAYLNRQYFTVFTSDSDLDIKKYMEIIIDFYRKTGIISVLLPEVFFSLIEIYSGINHGIVSKHINKFKYNSNKITSYKSFENEIYKTAEFKMNFLDNHIAYLKHNKLFYRLSNVNSFGCPIDDTNLRKMLRPLKKQYHKIRMIMDLYCLKKHKSEWGY